jgi:hypothetical protein
VLQQSSAIILPQKREGFGEHRPFALTDRRITGCAGINRHVVANERVVQERSSESILAPNLAVNIVKVLIEA